MEKRFKLPADQIIKLIPYMGGCIATDKITIDGEPIRYMYREEPMNDIDSGWRFFSGLESQEYVDNPDNSMIYDLNTIANYDQSIIPYLAMPVGIELERKEGTNTFDVLPG